jgi:hypothetical protein
MDTTPRTGRARVREGSTEGLRQPPGGRVRGPLWFSRGGCSNCRSMILELSRNPKTENYQTNLIGQVVGGRNLGHPMLAFSSWPSLLWFQSRWEHVHNAFTPHQAQGQISPLAIHQMRVARRSECTASPERAHVIDAPVTHYISSLHRTCPNARRSVRDARFEGRPAAEGDPRLEDIDVPPDALSRSAG